MGGAFVNESIQSCKKNFECLRLGYFIIFSSLLLILVPLAFHPVQIHSKFKRRPSLHIHSSNNSLGCPPSKHFDYFYICQQHKYYTYVVKHTHLPSIQFFFLATKSLVCNISSAFRSFYRTPVNHHGTLNSYFTCLMSN